MKTEEQSFVYFSPYQAEFKKTLFMAKSVFVTITINQKKFTTSNNRANKKKPTWIENFRIPLVEVKNQNLDIQVFNQKVIGKTKVLGETSIPFKNLQVSEDKKLISLEVYKAKKNLGHLKMYFQVVYNPEDKYQFLQSQAIQDISIPSQTQNQFQQQPKMQNIQDAQQPGYNFGQQQQQQGQIPSEQYFQIPQSGFSQQQGQFPPQQDQPLPYLLQQGQFPTQQGQFLLQQGNQPLEQYPYQQNITEQYSNQNQPQQPQQQDNIQMLYPSLDEQGHTNLYYQPQNVNPQYQCQFQQPQSTVQPIFQPNNQQPYQQFQTPQQYVQNNQQQNQFVQPPNQIFQGAQVQYVQSTLHDVQQEQQGNYDYE